MGDLNFSEYLDLPGVNWSTLKDARKSARHYWHRTQEQREDTRTLALGRAAHTAILEPDRFALDFVVWKGGRRAGKQWDAFCELHPDETIINEDEYERCLAMRDAVCLHPVARALIAKGMAEVALTWTDEETGLPCKGRVDFLGDTVLVDLKTTGDIDPIRFGINAGRMGYHAQLAFYLRGLKAKGLELPAKIIAVEQCAPHDVAVFALSEDDLWLGDCEVGRLLRLVAECKAKDEWPGSCPGESPLILPAWMFNEGADDDAAGLGIRIPAEEAA